MTTLTNGMKRIAHRDVSLSALTILMSKVFENHNSIVEIAK